MDGIEIKKLFNYIESGIIDTMGTCKQSLWDFYNSQNFNAKFIGNSVEVETSIKNRNINAGKTTLKIGLYAARCTDWRKNMYSQIAAVSKVENAILDIIPLEKPAKEFAELLKLEITGENKNLSRKKLMERMAENDVNLYVSFSECAPMVPLESFEMGVPCIIGNNCHYFKGTKLEEFLVVNDETSMKEIKEKIEKVLKNRDYVMKLYNEFKKQNIEQKEIQISEFIEE